MRVGGGVEQEEGDSETIDHAQGDKPDDGEPLSGDAYGLGQGVDPESAGRTEAHQGEDDLAARDKIACRRQHHEKTEEEGKHAYASVEIDRVEPGEAYKQEEETGQGEPREYCVFDGTDDKKKEETYELDPGVHCLEKAIFRGKLPLRKGSADYRADPFKGAIKHGRTRAGMADVGERLVQYLQECG